MRAQVRSMASLAVAAVLAAGSSFHAAAQQAGIEAEIRQLQQRYEDAWTAGDIGALVEMHTEDAVLWPATGGIHKGREAIRAYFEQAPQPVTFEITSAFAEPFGEHVLDVGTFSGTLSDEVGGGTFEGEYVALARQSDGELKLYRLVAFPERRPDG